MNLSGKITFIVEMFLVLISIYILSTFIGCTNQNDLKKDVILGNNFVVSKGIIYQKNNDSPFTGRIIDTVNSKVIEYDVVSGKKNGEFIIHYEDGTIQIKGEMKDNKNDGEWKYFYPTGQMESEGNFKNDKVNDKWTWYYENGKVKEAGIFIDGKREGKWNMYGRDGNLNTILTFREGKVISKQSSGEIKSI